MDELLAKAKSGDIEAFSQIITLYKKDLERIATSRLKDKNSVDDVLQKVYYKAYMNLGTLKENEKFKSWIFTILKYECIDFNKSLARRKEVSLNNLGDFLESPFNYDLESNISFEQMISNLSEDEKRLIKLKFEENLTNREISEELGVSYNTVRSKINRILKKITLILLILILFSGFAVLAVYIVKQIRAHFTTSLNSIDAAVENEFVQDIESDFVYDNDIGIKVDALILDDKNLDISFMYDVLNKEKYGNIEGIRILDYEIKNKNEILFNSNVDNSTNNCRQHSQKSEMIDSYFRNSVLLISNDYFSNINEINISINSISIKSNNKTEIVRGNWNLRYEINKLFNQRTKNNYFLVDNNKYVNKSNAILTDTSIQFDIYFNIELDNSEIQSITLYNNDSMFNWIKSDFNNNNLKIIFDLGKYNDNIDELNLEIPRAEEENIILKFRREL